MGRFLKPRFILVCAICAAPGIWLAVHSIRARRAAERAQAQEAHLARLSVQEIARRRIVYQKEQVESGVTFASVLEDLGVDSATAAKLVATVQPVFNLRGFAAGHSVTVARSDSEGVHAVYYRIDNERMLTVLAHGDGFEAHIAQIPSTTQTLVVTGQIQDSLFNAVTAAGELPELALRLAEIFQYDLDFYTDPQQGDTFRVLVEKRTSLEGGVLTYGQILAAEYVNAGRNYQAILFGASGGLPAYFNPQGQSLRKEFLHSPLRFAAPVTSRFSYHRMHPILKVYTPHLGVDYGAPVGTPVQAVADGRVVYAGWHGNAGNAICLQHARGYETYYFHLSRLLVHAGQRVAQGQRIGLVGQTGLATGPHLDFRVQRHGVFMNFARMHLPPAAPVPKAQWGDFAAARDRWLALMNMPQETLARAQPPREASNTGR